MPPSEVQEKLQLNKLKDKVWSVVPSCATTGEGLFEGLVSSLQFAQRRAPELTNDTGLAFDQRQVACAEISVPGTSFPASPSTQSSDTDNPYEPRYRIHPHLRFRQRLLQSLDIHTTVITTYLPAYILVPAFLLPTVWRMADR